jgi:hypothetical protein
MAEEVDKRMIRGDRFRHLCCGDFCAVCAWEGRKLEASPRPRIKIVARIGLCSCDWCLRQIGESGKLEASVTSSQKPGTANAQPKAVVSARAGHAASVAQSILPAFPSQPNGSVRRAQDTAHDEKVSPREGLRTV